MFDIVAHFLIKYLQRNTQRKYMILHTNIQQDKTNIQPYKPPYIYNILYYYILTYYSHLTMSELLLTYNITQLPIINLITLCSYQ